MINEVSIVPSGSELLSERYLTVKEVALMLRLSPMTIYRQVNKGALERVRVGRSFRIRESDVIRYLERAS